MNLLELAKTTLKKKFERHYVTIWSFVLVDA